MGSTPYETDEEWDGDEQLDLADDESLPWLEAGEDDNEAGGVDAARFLMIGVLAGIVLLEIDQVQKPPASTQTIGPHQQGISQRDSGQRRVEFEGLDPWSTILVDHFEKISIDTRKESH